jgi:hypothetical protein
MTVMYDEWAAILAFSIQRFVAIAKQATKS